MVVYLIVGYHILKGGRMLTYIKRTTTQDTEECELVAPKYWGMFTAQGNKSLQNKAKNLIKKLDEGKDPEQSILAFLRSYRRMSQSKNLSEAGDTEVRECVWMFLLKAGNAVDLSNDVLDYLWEHKKSYPF